MGKKGTYGNYKGKSPAGSVTQVKHLDGTIVSYASYKKSHAEQNISASAWLSKKKTNVQAQAAASSNNGSTRNPFGSNTTDSEGDVITGDSVITFDSSWLGHDGKELQIYPSSSDASSDEYNKFVMSNSEYSWSFTFDSSQMPAGGMGKMRNINSPTIVSITTGADGYLQNIATYSGRGGVAWNSSGMITDDASSNYYTTQTTIQAGATNSAFASKYYCARAVLWFDTSGLPAGKTIKKLKVKLKLKQHFVSQTDYGEILQIYEWDEHAPGGRITTTDFDAFDIVGGTVNMTNVSNNDWIEFDITGDLLANFQSNYSAASPSNGYGFMIRNRYDFDGASLTPTGVNYHKFYSADDSTAANRPILEVRYV
jgi:hypothetical protein